jgi:hypothetical protein
MGGIEMHAPVETGLQVLVEEVCSTAGGIEFEAANAYLARGDGGPTNSLRYSPASCR